MLATLTPQSFAITINWVFTVGIAMTMFYFLEIVYRVNKKWLIAIIILPPLCLIFIKEHWEHTKAACFFFISFYLIIMAAGLIAGYNMGQHTFEILQMVFLWPFFLAKWLTLYCHF